VIEMLAVQCHAADRDFDESFSEGFEDEVWFDSEGMLIAVDGEAFLADCRSALIEEE